MKNKLVRRDREREAQIFLPEDRTHNRPTFDPFTGHIAFPVSCFELR